MKILIKNVEGLNIPSRATDRDAGYDIVATTEPNIVGSKREISGVIFWDRIDYIEYGTNLFIAPESETKSNGIKGPGSFVWTEDWHTEIFPRSSISKYNLSLANSVGTIDWGYRNEIKCRFKYLFQPEDFKTKDYSHLYPSVPVIVGQVNLEKIYKKGDKIAQMKPRKNWEIDFELAAGLPSSERNTGGFGSTGQ